MKETVIQVLRQAQDNNFWAWNWLCDIIRYVEHCEDRFPDLAETALQMDAEQRMNKALGEPIPIIQREKLEGRRLSLTEFCAIHSSDHLHYRPGIFLGPNGSTPGRSDSSLLSSS